MASTARRRAASLLSLDLRMAGVRAPDNEPQVSPETEDSRPSDDDVTETLAKIGALVRKMAAAG